MSPVGSLNVLAVDDSNTNRQLMSAMLKKMGHRVTLAEDGVHALALCDVCRPDLVLMDVSMPVMSGFDTVREMRRRYAGWFPILFLSAQTSNHEVVEGLHAGGDDYLFKPVNYEILQAKIHNFQIRIEQNLSLLEYHARIEEETDTARDFIKQFTALDKIHDPLVRFFLKPAENFSGDLISVARGPDNCLHVLLADSAGHGLTAALAVIPITQPFYQMTAKGFALPAIVRELNRRVREYLPLPRFVAASVLSLDPATGIVQVWNGGCPPVLLLGEGADILHSFNSRHLPLGVVAADEFDAGLEYYKLVDQSGSLLMCSDGATEIDMGNGVGLGQAGMLAGTKYSSGGTLFDRVQEVINGHLGGLPPLDDIALIMVDVPLVEPRTPEPVLQRAISSSLEAREAGCGHGVEHSVWKFSLMLTARQIKHLDVVPFLLNIAGQIEGGRADGKLFLVLSELFNNALDHGLLKLDSTLKNEIDGMETYFLERAARLAELEQGRIFIRLDKLSCGCLKVSMKDSGDGFDFSGLVDIKHNFQRHGRGIALLDNMCSALQYSGNGSEVAAYVGSVIPDAA
ncbi:MAG: fused response regulator/phosphatase [Nitrosomonadales bacterium]|jgi:CheY-like chemotaxis protein